SFRRDHLQRPDRRQHEHAHDPQHVVEREEVQAGPEELMKSVASPTTRARSDVRPNASAARAVAPASVTAISSESADEKTKPRYSKPAASGIRTSRRAAPPLTSTRAATTSTTTSARLLKMRGRGSLSPRCAMRSRKNR